MTRTNRTEGASWFGETAGEIVSLVLVLVVAAGGTGCRKGEPLGKGKPEFALTSASISGGEIPKKFTCDGGDHSPELAWGGVGGAQSYALIVVDEDAPLGSFVHWVLFDLPSDKREIPESLPVVDQLADGSRQGENDFDKIGYGGPCPPGNSAHRYVFAVYAVDTKLGLPVGATRKQVEESLKGHILGRGELVGRYKR